MKSRFEFINRGFNKDILLIPGWATDYRIFSSLDLDYNYIFPLELEVLNFRQNLTDFLDNNAIKRLSILGWSQGGYLAAEFCAKNPERIEELILLNIRKKYELAILDSIGAKLKKNKEAYLYKFYLSCFSASDSAALNWFRANLLANYLESIKLETLLTGLEYLAGARIETEKLSGIKNIKILHGLEDKVAAFDEASLFAAGITQAKFIPLPGIGHISFLNPDFKTKLHE